MQYKKSGQETDSQPDGFTNSYNRGSLFYTNDPFDIFIVIG
jgi:hypothetical protein